MIIFAFIVAIWLLSKLAKIAEETRQRREVEKLKQEQTRRSVEAARLRAEWEQQKQAAREERERVAALERLAREQAREQERLEREQERERIKQEKLWEKQQREDAARDAKLAKLEAEQRKMRFQLDQIAEDLPLFQTELERLLGQVEDWQDRLHKAEQDLEWDELRMREAPSAVKGKEHAAHVKAKEQAEGKIISLEKAIRKVEKQIATAEFNRDEIQRKLSA